ncbi:MAG: hypothetical protein GWP19_11755 [Planctomycetia bacterium]|nr:hypothetical protein [Planctomycetia bacterium]
MALIDQLLNQIQTQADEDRQNNQELRLSMYLDDYKDQIITLLKSQFHKDNCNRLYPMFATYYNLFKKVVNLKSVIYKKEAKRIWHTRKDNEDENYSDLIKDSKIHSTMVLCNKLTNSNNTSFVRIIPNIQNQVIKYEAIPSENISIIQNPENSNEIIALLHRVTIRDSNINLSLITRKKINDKFRIKYFYWDKENYIILDADRKVLKKDGVLQEFENPYKDKNNEGIIPYTLFNFMLPISGGIWNETVNTDLYDGTLQVNVFQTYFNNLLKQAGYRQPVISGVAKDEIKTFNEKASDALQPIIISDPQGKISTFELSGNITDVQSAIHDIISEISDNHGVDFSSRTSSAQKMSGLALSISQEGIDNIREEQQPLYRESEKELAEKTVIIANKDLKSNIDVEGNFSIDFYEDKKDIPVKDKIEQDKFYLSKNLKSIIDLYREIDLDCWSDEEALKRIELNRQQNESLIDDFPFSPVDDEEEKEETENAEPES